jgi:hypothetical protein
MGDGDGDGDCRWTEKQEEIWKAMEVVLQVPW